MGRVYLNKNIKPKVLKLAEELGADYVHDELIVFKCQKKYGDNLMAVAIDKTALVVGTINDKCDNFERLTDIQNIFQEEVDWLIDILIKIRKHIKPFKRKGFFKK